MRGVTGVYDMTPDSRPILGEVPGIKGLYHMRRIFGHGIQDFSGDRPGDVGTPAGWRRQDRGYPLFRPSRFAEGAAIKAEFEYVDD